MNSLKDDNEIMSPLLGDDDFERSLLSAGRGDSSGPDVEAGWSRFAAQLAFVSGGVAPISGVHPLPEGAQLPPMSSPPSPTLIDATGPSGVESVIGTSTAAVGTKAALSALSLKVLLIGAVGGSLLLGGAWYALSSAKSGDSQKSVGALEIASSTATQKPEARSPALNAPNVVKVATPSEVNPEQNSDDDATSLSELVEIDSQGKEKKGSALSDGERQPRSPGNPQLKKRSKSASKEGPQDRYGSVGPLTAQVLLLDAAREAPASRALHLIDEFHARFPKAALRADAEIIALRALHTLGNKTDLKLRGEHFLKRYPSDTHAERVRHWLTE
jgi:hypothetical protein